MSSLSVIGEHLLGGCDLASGRKAQDSYCWSSCEFDSSGTELTQHRGYRAAQSRCRPTNVPLRVLKALREDVSAWPGARGEPDAARGAEHQQRLAGLEPSLPLDRDVARDVSDGERAGLVEAHAVGDGEGLGLRRDSHLSETAIREDRHHSIAG